MYAIRSYYAQMIAVSTTCMAEVIGDDLNAFIGNAKKEGHIEQDFPVITSYSIHYTKLYEQNRQARSLAVVYFFTDWLENIRFRSNWAIGMNSVYQQ